LARAIDDETFAASERAYNDHGVIFFHDQRSSTSGINSLVVSLGCSPVMAFPEAP
jgi:hypothetical protein